MTIMVGDSEPEFLHRFKQALDGNVGEFIPSLFFVPPVTLIDYMYNQGFILMSSNLDVDDVILTMTFCGNEIKLSVKFELMYGSVSLRKL